MGFGKRMSDGRTSNSSRAANVKGAGRGGKIVKISSVATNGRRRAFEVKTSRQTYLFPFARAVPAPSASDPVVSVYSDPEMGYAGFTYQLLSGIEGSVHIDSVLEVNEDPKLMADLVMYRLSLEAQRRMEESGENVRDIARALRTSPTQRRSATLSTRSLKRMWRPLFEVAGIG